MWHKTGANYTCGEKLYFKPEFLILIQTNINYINSFRSSVLAFFKIQTVTHDVENDFRLRWWNRCKSILSSRLVCRHFFSCLVMLEYTTVLSLRACELFSNLAICCLGTCTLYLNSVLLGLLLSGFKN